MKRFPPVSFCAALMLLACGARADLIITQKIDGAGQSGTMTMKIKGDKVRSDVSPELSMITDATSGDVTTIMHSQKSYIVTPASSTKALMEKMQKTLPQSTAGASPVASKLAATGKKETINGYETEQYTASLGSMKMTYWIAPSFPAWKKVLEAMMAFQRGSLAAMAKGMMPGASDFSGMPMKTEVDLGGQKITTTVESVQEEPVADTEFQIPAGYTEMKMPSFNMPQQ
jgi:hypothetical protein